MLKYILVRMVVIVDYSFYYLSSEISIGMRKGE